MREEEDERIFGQLKINLRCRISKYIGAKSEGDGAEKYAGFHMYNIRKND